MQKGSERLLENSLVFKILMAQPKHPITSFGLVLKVSMKSGNGSDWLMLDTSKYSDFSCVGSSLQIKGFPSFLKNSQNIVIAATLLSCKTNLSLGKNFGHKKVARICASCLSILNDRSESSDHCSMGQQRWRRWWNQSSFKSCGTPYETQQEFFSLERNILISKMKYERVRVYNATLLSFQHHNK